MVNIDNIVINLFIKLSSKHWSYTHIGIMLTLDGTNTYCIQITSYHIILLEHLFVEK